MMHGQPSVKMVRLGKEVIVNQFKKLLFYSAAVVRETFKKLSLKIGNI